MKYYVYIVRCKDDTLYTGITKNLQKRIKEHNKGKGAKYTRGRFPVRLCYVEEGAGVSWALKREREIKRLSRSRKQALIEKMKGEAFIAGTKE